MKKYLNKRTLSVVLVLALIVGLFGGYAFNKSSKASAKTAEDIAKDKLLEERNRMHNSNLKMDTAASEKELVRAIITLKAKSVADTNNISDYNSKLKSKENKIISKQAGLVKQVEKITGNEVVNQTAYLVNSISIDATRKQMKQIAKLDGVDTVYEASTYTTTMATAVDEGNVRQQWESEEYGYTGEGVVVSIIDTGVNYKHRDMELDEGVKNKYTKEEWKEKIELLGYGKYFTEKVPFGYDYSENKNDCLSKKKDHGYHVAGITASNGEVIGVAKNAQVLGMKVFSDKGQGASTDDIVKAIEDSVKLGSDIINMSLGYSKAVVSDEDFSQLAVANATRDGVICVIAAGNDGTSSSLSGDDSNILNMRDTNTLGTPAISKSALTVASADNIGGSEMSIINATVNGVEQTFEYFDFVGHGFDMSDLEMIDVGIAVDGNRKSTFKSADVKDKLAVVMRGTSTFNDKMFRLSKAGAKGIILVDYTDQISTNIACNDWYGVPIIVVGNTTGKMLIDAAQNSGKFNTISTKVKEEIKEVRMSSFSSWGSTNEIDIKPEITAPGGNITAPVEGKDKYARMSGTSMASPFIAGSQAVMLNAIQARGLELKGADLANFMKSSLMNTADCIINPDTKLPYSVRKQGAGMVDVYGAVDNNVIATVNNEAKVELREVTNGQTFEIKLTNYGSEVANYTLADTQLYVDYTSNNVESNSFEYGIKPVEGAVIKYSVSEITVPANDSVTINATVIIPDNYEKEHFVEGFIRLEGKDVQCLGMPVLGYNGDWDSETIIDSPIYEQENAYFNGVNNLVGLSSSTGLVGYGNGELDDYLGRKYSKVNGLDGDVSVKDATSAQLSTEEKANIGRVAVTTGLVEKDVPNKEDALSVKVGDSAELAIVNAGDYGLYKLSAKENTGCKIYVDSALVPEIYIYDKNMNFVTGTVIESSLGLDVPFEINFKQGKKYYVKVVPKNAETGLSTIRFVKSTYFENEDLSLLETHKKQTKINYLKVNRTTNAVNDGENEKSFVFECKKDGFYTFTIDTDSFVKYALYEFTKNKSDKMSYVDTVAEGTEFSKAVIEVQLKGNSKYALDLISDAQYITSEDFASVSVKKSDGSSLTSLNESFDGRANAISPNADGVRDAVVPYITQLRNAAEVSVKVLDADKNVVRTVAKCIDTSKLTLPEISAGYFATELMNYAIGDMVNWDGKVYNKATKEFEVAKDGQYYIQLESKLSNDSEPQIVTMPVKLDTVAPTVESYSLVKKGNDTVLAFSTKDNNSLSPYYYVYIVQNAKDANNGMPMEGAVGQIYAATAQNEKGEYEFNLGRVKNADVYLMVEDAAGNYALENVVVSNKNILSEEEYYEDEYAEEDIDVSKAPTIELIQNDTMNVVNNYSLQKAGFALLNEKASSEYSFQIKVSDKDSKVEDIQVMYMDAAGGFGMATPVGNGLYDVTINRTERVSTLMLFAFDEANNSDYLITQLYDASKEEEFNLMCREYDFIVSANLDETIITKDMLNEDGTFTVRGNLGAMPDKFTINDEVVTVNPEDNSFAYNVKVNSGKIRINLVVEKNGIVSETSAELYYDDIVVDFAGSIQSDENGVVNVTTDTFNLAGTITSYVNIGMINVNGDNVFVGSESITASINEPIIRNFNYQVKLDQGVNNITLEIIDLSGQKVVKELVVNYTPSN